MITNNANILNVLQDLEIQCKKMAIFKQFHVFCSILKGRYKITNSSLI